MEDNTNVLDQKLDSILESKNAIKQAIINKGQQSNEVLADYASQIDNIVTLSDGTQDADATSDDIALNKTAYVKGEKITGNITTIEADSILEEEGLITLQDSNSGEEEDDDNTGGSDKPVVVVPPPTDPGKDDIVPQSISAQNDEEDDDLGGPGGVVVVPPADKLKLSYKTAANTLLRSKSTISLYTNYSSVSNVIGLTPSILKKGEKVLNITGTLENDYTGTITPEDYTECLNLSNEILGKESIIDPPAPPNDVPPNPDDNKDDNINWSETT